MRHLFILNPAAGRKDITAKLKKYIESLVMSDKYDIFITDSCGSAEAEAERYLSEDQDDFTKIYACGGDGTLSEVANGIYKSKNENCALGIVPVGSGNDFVRSLDIPAESFRNIKNLVNGEIKPIDLLLARDNTGKERVSMNIISAGFDAAVAKGQQNFKKLPLVNGSMAYNLSLVKCLFSNLKNYFTVLADGEAFGKSGNGPYLFAIAANGKYYGGGFKASPYSDLCDGLLDLIRIDTVSRPRFIQLVSKFREGKHIDDYKDIVTYTQCRKMQIVSDKDVDLNLDGEIHPMRNPIVEIIPNALKLLLPRTSDDQ